MATTDMRSLSIAAVSPQGIKNVLLNDGEWHKVTDAQITHFGVAESQSPPRPQKLYPALTFNDQASGKRITVPFRSVVAYETSETSSY